MAPFDIQGAKSAGYSDDDIIGHLADENKFDVKAARDAGYSNDEILAHLTSAPPDEPAPEEPGILDRATLAIRKTYNDPKSSTLEKVGAGVAAVPLAAVKMVAGIPGAIADTVSSAGQAARGELTPEGLERAGRNMAMMIAPGGLRGAGPVLDAAATKAIPPPINPMVSSARISASQALRDTSQQAYKVMENSGVRISPESFQNFADQLSGKLEGFNPKLPSRAPETADLLKDLKNYANEEDTIKFSELENMRQSIGDSSLTTKPNDRRLVDDIKDHLDDYMEGLSDSDFDVGTTADANAARKAVGVARDLWRKNAKIRRFEEIQTVAPKQENPDLYIRQRFSAITRNPRLYGQYSKSEQQLIDRLAKQGSLGTLGRAAPHFTPAGMVKGAIYGGAAAGPLGAAGAGIAAAGSTAAFHAAQLLRQARLQKLINNIAGTPEELAAKRAEIKALQGPD